MPDRAFDQLGNVVAVERYCFRCLRLDWTTRRIARQTDLRQLCVVVGRHNFLGGLRLRPHIQINAVTRFHLHPIVSDSETEHTD
jgi:hypothetical protein